MSILDQLAAQQAVEFRPQNTTEFFALRLAIRLGKPQSVHRLCLLASEHGADTLAAAFQRAVIVTGSGENLADRFYDEVRKSWRNGLYVAGTTLAGIRIERRCIGAALFRYTRLEGIRVRQLPAQPDKAEVTAAAFIGQLIRDHGVESAAIEVLPPDTQEIQRAVLTRLVLGQFREQSVSVWELSKKVVAAAFGYPPLNTRVELREVIQTIWPQLQPQRHQVCVLDAAAMGLLIQTERLFNNF